MPPPFWQHRRWRAAVICLLIFPSFVSPATSEPLNTPFSFYLFATWTACTTASPHAFDLMLIVFICMPSPVWLLTLHRDVLVKSARCPSCFPFLFIFCFVFKRRCFIPPVRKVCRTTLSLDYRFCALLEHKLKIVACRK